MKIDSVHISGYRCIGDLDVRFDNLRGADRFSMQMRSAAPSH
jgi:hypothetical protein